VGFSQGDLPRISGVSAGHEPSGHKVMSEPPNVTQRSRWAWGARVRKSTWALVTIVGGTVGAVLAVIQLVNWVTGISENPIRANYVYGGSPYEGVVMRKFDNFDPKKVQLVPLSYAGDPLAYSYPFMWIDVTNQAEDETVALSPYLVVQVTDVKPMPDKVNYVVYPAGGAAGEIDYFVATLAPEREGIFYAPQQTKDTVLGPMQHPFGEETGKIESYYTLSPGARQAFVLNITMLPDSYYRFRVGVQYSYKGDEGVDWSDKEFAAGVPRGGPHAAVVWKFRSAGSGKRLGDLQEYENETRRKPGGRLEYRRYSKTEVQEAIDRQNAAVRNYSYPYTPPEQLNAPGEG
jgi:hypothetical protein